MAKLNTSRVTDNEPALDSTSPARPWTASTASTANNTDHPRTGLSAPQKASIARTRSEAWRSRSKRRSSIEARNTASRRSSHTGMIQTRDVSPLNITGTPSVMSVSPTTTAYSTPKITPQHSRQSLGPPRRPPRLRLEIPGKINNNDLHADLHWQINAQNPQNWSKSKKWMHTVVPAALAFVFALGSSTVTMAHDTIMHKLQTSSTGVVLTLALYVLGLSFGPYLSTLVGEIFGRKSVYMICVPLYAIFMLASGLVQLVPGLLLCRFFAGVFASPALHMGWSTLGDLWTSEEKIFPIAVYLSSIFLGSTIGPVLGAYLIYEESWRWTQYVVLCALGGCLVPVMMMQETSKTAILRRRRGESARAPIERHELTSIFVKPLRMLFTEPIVSLYAVYAAFNFGVLYAVYAAFPGVLAHAEHFDRGSQGLSFLGMTIGVIIALALFIVYETFVYEPRVAMYKAERATEEEKTLQTGHRASQPNHLCSDQPSSNDPRRNSLLTFLRRLSSAGYKNIDPPRTNPQRNVNLAVAAAKYMNSNPANKGTHIMPERILLLLNQNLEFAHLCVALEGYKLKFNRIELAKVLYNALQEHAAIERAATEMNTMPQEPKSMSSFSSLRSHPSPRSTVAEKRKTWLPPSNVPPPEWRLWPALPASAVIAGSLFMLGWTAHRGIHWIVPIVAMFLYALSSLTTFLSTTFYVLDCYGPVHSQAAIGGSMMLVFLLGFAFPLFAQPMYTALGAGLATSVFAFVAVALGLVPSLLYVFGTTLRRRQKWKESK